MYYYYFTGVLLISYLLLQLHNSLRHLCNCNKTVAKLLHNIYATACNHRLIVDLCTLSSLAISVTPFPLALSSIAFIFISSS